MEPNLVMMCGSGTTGCHGLLEAHHGPTKKMLAGYLLSYRPDTVAYIMEQKGNVGAADWFRRQMEA